MTKQLRFVILFVQTFISRHSKQIGLGALIGFLATLLLFQIYPIYRDTFGQITTKVGMVGRFTENTLPLSLRNQISLGLTTLLPNGEATSSLSPSWQVDEKGTTYTFQLLPDIHFHDGSRFTAKDVTYKLREVIITPENETTLKVTLKEPYAPLPVVLSQPILKPNLIGMGIQKVSRADYTDDFLTKLTLVNQKTGKVTVYRFYPSQEEAFLAYKLGEVDILESLSEVGPLTNWKNTKVTATTQYDRFVGVFFNLKNPLFKEKEVRQALTYAIPKIDDFEKVYSPISPVSWAYSSNIRLYNYDPDVAQKILSKSPLASDSAIMTLSVFAPLLTTAQFIADSWNKLGLDVKVRVENALPQEFDMMVLTIPIPPDPDQYHYWQTTQEATNIAKYSNLKIDKLLEDGRKTLDQEKRTKIYADFQRYLVDDNPVIFLYHPKIYTIVREN
ncbi:ABC transporter substrate-binding protein [Candidatus Gottesmanbacteria bacterium]|nr:ABC transporter substrate-binding protein [Candidatus Gottesmanbacteria bacterium]